MSTFLGIGIPANVDKSRIGHLSDNLGLYDISLNEIKNYKYGPLKILDIFADNMKIDIYSLDTPPNKYGIKDNHAILVGMKKHNTIKSRPLFFDVIGVISFMMRGRCSFYYVFFASEWQVLDRLRAFEGTPEEAIQFLKYNGGWEQVELIPKTGRYQDNDETPLILRIAI